MCPVERIIVTLARVISFPSILEPVPEFRKKGEFFFETPEMIMLTRIKSVILMDRERQRGATTLGVIESEASQFAHGHNNSADG